MSRARELIERYARGSLREMREYDSDYLERYLRQTGEDMVDDRESPEEEAEGRFLVALADMIIRVYPEGDISVHDLLSAAKRDPAVKRYMRDVEDPEETLQMHFENM